MNELKRYQGYIGTSWKVKADHYSKYIIEDVELIDSKVILSLRSKVNPKVVQTVPAKELGLLYTWD